MNVSAFENECVAFTPDAVVPSPKSQLYISSSLSASVLELASNVTAVPTFMSSFGVIVKFATGALFSVSTTVLASTIILTCAIAESIPSLNEMLKGYGLFFESPALGVHLNCHIPSETFER